MEYRVITKAMHLYPYQHLYFTTLEYDNLKPVFPEVTHTAALSQLADLKDIHVLLLTGIASPEQMVHDLSPYTENLSPLTFSDHHQFRQKDVELINDTFAALPSPRCIITTEKDVTRLHCVDGLNDEVKASLYVLPVRICFMQEQEETFNNNIIDYVRKNSRNSILAKGKDDHKSHNGHHSGDRPRTISFRNN